MLCWQNYNNTSNNSMGKLCSWRLSCWMKRCWVRRGNWSWKRLSYKRMMYVSIVSIIRLGRRLGTCVEPRLMWCWLRRSFILWLVVVIRGVYCIAVGIVWSCPRIISRKSLLKFSEFVRRTVTSVMAGLIAYWVCHVRLVISNLNRIRTCHGHNKS